MHSCALGPARPPVCTRSVSRASRRSGRAVGRTACRRPTQHEFGGRVIGMLAVDLERHAFSRARAEVARAHLRPALVTASPKALENSGRSRAHRCSLPRERAGSVGLLWRPPAQRASGRRQGSTTRARCAGRVLSNGSAAHPVGLGLRVVFALVCKRWSS